MQLATFYVELAFPLSQEKADATIRTINHYFSDATERKALPIYDEIDGEGVLVALFSVVQMSVGCAVGFQDDRALFLDVDLEPADKNCQWSEDELNSYIRQAVRCLRLEAKAIGMPYHLNTSYAYGQRTTPISSRNATGKPKGISDETLFYAEPHEIEDTRLCMAVKKVPRSLAEVLGMPRKVD